MVSPAALRRFTRHVLRFGLLLLVVLLLLEASLRLTASYLPQRLRIPVQYVQTGERYTPNRVADHSFWLADYGPVLAPGLQDELIALSPEVRVRVTTHSIWGAEPGFRTPPVNYIVDAVVVGDSFSFCFTEYADCWVTRFSQETGLGVVNLGLPGTGSMSHYRVVERFATPLEPRLVIWQFYGNDFHEDYGLAVVRGDIDPLPSEPIGVKVEQAGLVPWLRQHSALYAVLDSLTNGLWPYVGDYEQLFVPTQTVAYRDGLLNIGFEYEHFAFDVNRPQNRIGVEISRTALAQAKQLVESWGGHLVVVIIPNPSQAYAHLARPALGEDWMRPLDNAHATILQICTDLELTCFDALPHLQLRAQWGEHLYYTNDMHLNPHGNAVLSELVWGWLGGQGLLYAD